jgi:O-antigen ligase
MPISPATADPAHLHAPAQDRFRWAPGWVLAFVALWPERGPAEVVLSLGALLALALLVAGRFRGGARLSNEGWALTSVLFLSYWLPEAVSAIGAENAARSATEAAKDLRYLPFLWLAGMAVSTPSSRAATLQGIGAIALAWAVDAVAAALLGASPVRMAFSALGAATGLGGGCAPTLAGCPSGLFERPDMLGLVLASLAPFALHLGARRAGTAGWLLVAVLLLVAIVLSGSRAAWVGYALVLLVAGGHQLGWRRIVPLMLAGALALVGLAALNPAVGERVALTAEVLEGDSDGLDAALSGRLRIWQAAACMAWRNPVNGVGVRGFRDAWDACDPEPEVVAAWGLGPALHAHQLVLEVLSETGLFGLALWGLGAAIAWRAWRFADAAARERARPAMLALAVTVFPFNTHLAFYSTFWGGVTLLLVALYAGALLARDPAGAPARAPAPATATPAPAP